MTAVSRRPRPTPSSKELEVDAPGPTDSLIVELDSYEFHGTRDAFESDRSKDRRLTAAGWTVIRITWRDLDDPEALARELEALGL